MQTSPTDEREALEARIDVQRAAIRSLLDDVTDAQARARLVPSLTTVLGLVTHATFVEKVWFQHRIDGNSRAEVGIPETVDESFVPDPADTVDSVRAAYDEACERSRQIAQEHRLDEVFEWHVGPVNLRFILGHMVSELARHAGHGDILVEQLKAADATD
ncbi:MAG: DinB family protein [Rhodococcus sp. (in: high G+C Gram-positive bacteria)]|nr:MAG: DinB family protein [Rhodococcus sp. (in: high G+C Gram-positive bacteria)]